MLYYSHLPVYFLDFFCPPALSFHMSTSDKPLISILLPVHNSSSYLSESLKSLFNQSYDNFEIIAIDDFSSDESFKILKSFKKRDKRIRIYKNVKQYGKSLTLNRAIKRSKGQFIVFMDPEDICLKDKLSRQLNFLLSNPRVVAAGTQCRYINNSGKRLGKSNFPDSAEDIYNKPFHGISMQFQTVMVNRLNLPKDIPYFPTNGHPFLYSDVLLKMLAFGELRNLPHPPLQYHRKSILKPSFTLSQIPLFIKLWITSIANYDYRPNLRHLLSQLSI